MAVLGRRLLVVLALGAGAASMSAAENAPDLMGRVVESVSFTADGPVDNREVGNLIIVAAGKPLTEEATSATIRNLFGTLGFSDIVIEAEPVGENGVAVTVQLWRAFHVGGVSFEGKAALSREEMRRVVPFSEGDLFNGGALSAGGAAIERRLTTEGYLHPSVDPEATFDPAAFGVTIVYKIDAGERARVASPFFDGEIAPFAPELLAQKGKIREGKPYTESRARTAAERIRKFLLEQGRLKANVELIAAEPTDSGQIRPVYRIAVGPQFLFEAGGIKEKVFRKEAVALVEGQGYDPEFLQQWTEDTSARLQRDGYYRVQVAAKSTEVAQGILLKATVEVGRKYSVEKIAFSGNSSVSAQTLAGLMVTREKGLPVIQKGRLLDLDLDADVSAILGYYQTHGWIGAKVQRAVTEGARPDRLDLTITVAEGPRTFVAERLVEGAEHLAPAEIDNLVAVKVGAPFNPSATRQDVAALTSQYRNTGWRQAVVQEQTTISEDRTQAHVVYRVDEGMRTFFGKTIVRGNAVTRLERITRQIAWKEGEPFSEQKLAETQRNLGRAGVFRSMLVRPQPVDPDNQEQNIDVDLTEARRLSLLYGVGYQYAQGASSPSDPFVTLGVSYRNLFGRMQSASFEVQYAPVSRRGYVVANLLEPYLFDTDFPLTVAAFASREPIQDIDINRLGTFVESARHFGHLRLAMRYSYQYIAPENPQDLSTIIIDKYPLSARPIRQSAVGPSFLYDRRDDVLDPHKGYYVTMAGSYAFPFLNADAWYGKVSGQAAYFLRVPGGVLAASVRVGGIYPHSVTPEGDTVPIAEKFFAGGSSTARGFDTDLEGIPASTVDYNTQATLEPDTQQGAGSCAQTYDFPDAAAYNCSPGPRIIGGNGFMAWGLEYRIPIVGNFGLSVFYDLAQVWVNPGQIHLGIEGRTGLRQSVGLGLHYLTPIGPLRLEVARPVELRTIPFDVTTTDENNNVIILKSGLTTKETGRIFLSIGYPF